MFINSKTHIFMIVFSLLLLAISFGMSQVIAETPQPKVEKKMEIKWGKPTVGVVCAVTLRQKSIEHHVDQPIWINLHIKNTSSKKIGFVFTNVLMMYKFHIIDPNGKDVLLTFYGMGQNHGDAFECYLSPLKPGTTYQHSSPFWLNRYFDMTLPETYQISFMQEISYLDNKKSVAVTVTSITLQIKVIEPSKSSSESKPQKPKIKWGTPHGRYETTILQRWCYSSYCTGSYETF